MKKILVPVDGSTNSKLALEKAKELAKMNNGQVTVVTIVKDLSAQLYNIENKDKQEIRNVFKKQGEEILKDGLEVFKECSGEIGSLLLNGDPAQEIISLSQTGDYDLIIMGSRGLNAFSRLMIGSVSNKVLNHVSISVLIVK